MLSEEEFDQVAMFPTMLRLYYHGPLRDELDGLTRAQLDRCEEGRAWKCVCVDVCVGVWMRGGNTLCVVV